uniref:Tetratricopeptide repeat protein n=1 Tax=candidate division WOR-3 bacterium TaxID=2052148 RepID=A0A7V3RHI6_UNCW3
MKCPRCGYNNPETANFCSRCGLQLIKTSGQRRPVAVIFADISGFTTLAERLDPEETKDLIDECLQRLARVIQKYEGFIDKFIGDCIMALFGAPVAHEDDPLRAVLAGIDLMKEIKEFNKEKRQKLSLSIGINYGLVATGDLGRPGGYTVMGDTVNLAQRLQSVAPRGMIYVSEEVYRNTYREIVYKKIKRIKVKGRKEKVLIFSPTKVRLKYGQRKIQEIPLVGRVEEMNMLNKLFKNVQSGRGQIVAIVGEAGIGKTKLVYEFIRQWGRDSFIAEGKGIEYHKNSPYFVLKDILKKIFNITDIDTPVQIARKITRFLEKLDDTILKLKLSYYKYFLSGDLTKSEKTHLESMQVEDRSRLLLEAINSLFLRLSKDKPLIIIFDDCHWIDKETLDFMSNFAGLIGYKPIMMITVYRPQFDPGKIRGLPYFNSIQLKPLNVNETSILLKKILNCEEISENLLNLLLHKSGAIPFYISELAFNLRDNNVINIKDGVAQLKEGAAVSLPRTLDELIMTKIDNLNPELRYIVDVASVIGEEFSFNLLNALIPGKERLKQDLAYIVQQNIFKVIEDKGAPGEEKYSFTHSIIRDAVYNSLLKKQRKEYHQKVAYMMEKVFSLTIEEYFDALAHHFYLGGETMKAVEYLEKAGDQKKELYLNNSAIEIYKNCLKFVPDSMPQVFARIYRKLGNVYELIGDYANAMKSYQKMEIYAGNDFVVKAQALRHQANIMGNQGNYGDGLELLSKAMKYLRLVGDQRSKPVLIESSYIKSFECMFFRSKGKIELAENRGLESVEIIKAIKNWKFDMELKRALIKAYNHLSVVYCIKSEYDKALSLCEETVRMAEEIGDLRSKVDAYNVMGTVFKAKGDYERAIDAFTMNLKISEELGDKMGMGTAYCNLGNVYQHKGDFSTAFELYQKFLEISHELKDKSSIGMALNNMAIIHFNMGNYEKALKYFESYRDMSKELGDKRGEAIAYGNMGEVLLSQFAYNKALRLFKKFLSISEKIGDKRSIGTASYGIGQVYTELGRFKLANQYLFKAKGIFESIGNKVALGLVINSLAYLKIKEDKIEEAMKLLNDVMNLIQATNFQELKIHYLFNMARAYSSYDKDKSESNFIEAIELSKKHNNKRLLADICYEYAKFLMLYGNTKRARDYQKEAMKYYKELKIKRK